MKLSKAWISQIFFTLVEHGAVRILDALITFCLIRVLTQQHFGLFSLYQSWVGILLLFLPALEVILYRTYASLKQSGKLASELDIYWAFNQFRLILATIAVFVLCLLPNAMPYWIRVSLFSFAIALPLSNSIYGILREPLRFEMRQKTVAFISFFQRFCLILVIALTYFLQERGATQNAIYFLAIGALSSYVLFGWIWILFSKDLFPKREKSFLPNSKKLRTAFSVFFNSVVWLHINGSLVAAIQTLDTLALGSNHLALEEIGHYAIALKAANFFQIVPVALINSFGVYLARANSDFEKEKRLIFQFSFIFLIGCVVLYLFGGIASEPLLSFLTKGKLDSIAFDRTQEYFHWQLIGVLIQCASFPLSTYLGARGKLKELTFYIFIPFSLISTLVYFYAASLSHDQFYNVLMTAKANSVVYGVLVFLMVSYYGYFYGRMRRSNI
ncbi:MAG: lipopolysaccharide biosynthesis protein [Bacteriovoracia bacterium]